MDIKRCFKCGMDRPLSDFYRHSQMADGHLNKCIDCTKEDVARHSALHPGEQDRKRNMKPHRVQARRDYLKTEAGRKARRNSHANYRERNPQKYKAQVAVSNALRDRRLVRQACEFCGNQKAEAHHDDYSKPLEVRWLCNAHHRAEHRKESNGQTT